MKDPNRYHPLAKRKLVDSESVLHNYSLLAILLLVSTWFTEDIVHFLHSAGQDLLVFPLMLVFMTLKTNVK